MTRTHTLLRTTLFAAMAILPLTVQAAESKELLAEAEKLQIPMEPAYGEDVAAMIRAALTQDADTVKMIDALINAK